MATVRKEEQFIDEIIARGMRDQIEWLQNHIARGASRVGWKIGITDAAAQAKWGITEPVVGALAGNHAFQSGADVPVRKGAVIRGEAEIAIRVGEDVPAGCTLEQAHAAIVSLSPAIELIDIAKPGSDLATILSHSIFHAGVVFGAEFPPETLQKVEPYWPRAFRNGKAVRQPEPKLVPENLGRLVTLVANLLPRYSEALKAGDRIISGSFVTPMIGEHGDTMKVDFGALGKVELRVVSEE
ncbi:MAG TPA: fumarylacetoacetate hydrolase family protein [Gammaproteobacteria bacterium]|nr:fumarylacetoacetate hydrolase family protein [Gammaproteobacteria bacterium]